MGAQQGGSVLWLPVAVIAGALVFFLLKNNPPFWAGPALAGGGLAGFAFLRLLKIKHDRAAREPKTVRIRVVLTVFCLLLGGFGIGFFAAGLHTAGEAPPMVLPYGYLPLSGEVLSLTPTTGGRSHLRLGSVELIRSGERLARVLQITLPRYDRTRLYPGEEVRLKAELFPPYQASYPSGWDPGFYTYFHELAGYGYTFGHVHPEARAFQKGLFLWWQGVREDISRRILQTVPGPDGAIASLLLSGKGSMIPTADRAAFDTAGLAHLLSVAGLHLAIVMGLIYFFFRGLLKRSVWLLLHGSVRNSAALAALAGGFFYLCLTGGHLPTERSFIMAVLFTAGLMFGRRVISLRGLGLAAILLILAEPYAVFGAGFQMSFAVVLTLIGGYELIGPLLHKVLPQQKQIRFITLALAEIFLTSLLAGCVALPYVAYNFGSIQPYFIPANMIAVPVTALWILPLGLLSLLLMPFHQAALTLIPMGLGIGFVLNTAKFIAGLPGASFLAPFMPGFGLLLFSFGLVWFFLWRGKIRFLAVFPILAGLLSPLTVVSPVLLLSGSGQMMAVRADKTLFVWDKRAVSSYTLRDWIYRTGIAHISPLPEERSLQMAGFRCRAGICRLDSGGRQTILIALNPAALPASCPQIRLIVSPLPLYRSCNPHVLEINRGTTKFNGAVLVGEKNGRLHILTDRSAEGQRPWVLFEGKGL